MMKDNMREQKWQEAKQTLAPEKRHMLEQVEATMTIEDMPLTDKARQNLLDLASGKKTVSQIIAELDEEYKNG